MTLNTFHFAGVASKSNVTRGVPRIEEILSLSENPKNPSVTVVLKEKDMFDKHKAQDIKNKLEHTKLVDITKSIGIYFDPDDLNTLIHSDLQLIQQYKEFQMLTQECNGSQNQDGAADDDSGKSKWVIRIELDKESMLDRNITMDEVNFAIKNSYQDDIKCVYSDFNDDKLIMRLRISNITKSQSKKNIKPKNLDQSDEIYILKNFQDKLLTNIVLRGIKNIGKVIVRKIPDSVIENNGNYEKKETWVLDTVGTNMMDILSLDYIDANGTFSNDIQEINNVLGIEAARQTIYNELAEVIEFDGTYINYHHMALLCDRMTCKSKMVSIFRHGINNDDIGPIAKASFEETPEMFLKAARHAELDNMRGVSANVMCGQEGYYGTSAFKTILNIKEMMNMEAENYSAQDDHNMNTTTEDDASKLNMKITPEMMIKIFRRISDEDVAFMGFSPIWSRPDWMICQVLAVPPPAVRPSVKVDSQQRSEDDISHILVSIIKTNNTLQEKIKQNANTSLIDDWTTTIVTLRGKKVFNYENKILVFTFLLSLVSFISMYIWFYLITNFDAAFTLAVINPITIITTMIVGYLFFNEEITRQQVLGTIIVTIGLVVLIMGKSKQVKKLGKN